jgi:glycerol-3-phosphate dehydrogenase (NAD(P)+)
MRAVVVGGGSWGSTFAALLAEREHEVVLACRDPEQVAAIEASGRNPRYVRGLDLSGVTPWTIDDAPFAEADVIVVAVPSRSFHDVVDGLPQGVPVLSLVKGLDPVTGDRLSRAFVGRPFAMLSGPNHAEEIGDGLPAAAVIASESETFATTLQHEIISPRFRVYVNADLVGVEHCAAAKNVIALGAGAVDGLGMGDNGKAALITRGLSEMTRLGDAFGARPETFSGLAGMGDLIVTCWSRHSRNRRAGELIARGASADEARAEIAMAVEGLTTAPLLRDLARSAGIELPITEAVCRVLEGESVRGAVAALMGRAPTGE